MYMKITKAATVGITSEESDLFESVSRCLDYIINRMETNGLDILSDNVGATIGTLDDVKKAYKIVNGIAMHMAIDNKGAK